MIPEFIHAPKKPELSTLYDPVHMTHVGFNSPTGESTGLPREWKQPLQENSTENLEHSLNVKFCPVFLGSHISLLSRSQEKQNL